MPLTRVNWRITDNLEEEILASGTGPEDFRQKIIECINDQIEKHEEGMITVKWEPIYSMAGV